MTEFAAALNKQHRDEMAALSGAAVTERVEALEKRLAKVEALLADRDRIWNSVAGPPMALPPAPAADPGPEA